METITVRQPRYSQIFEHDDEMLKYACQFWKEVIEHLEDNDLLTKTRLRVADRYARTLAEYHCLYPEAVKAGPVKVGPNGGDVFNFQWSAIEKLNERLAKFEASLLILPKDANDKLAGRKPDAPATAADEFLD